MAGISKEELLYLLYVLAYSEEGTVTRGTVRDAWLRDNKGLTKAKGRELEKDIFEKSTSENFIDSPKRGRIMITSLGRQMLTLNLSKTNYRFNSPKGPKVLNALLECLAFLPNTEEDQLNLLSFDEFSKKFKEIYFEEKKKQEQRGVVAVKSFDILEKIREETKLSQEKIDQLFNQLKTSNKIFFTFEKGQEIVEWSE